MRSVRHVIMRGIIFAIWYFFLIDCVFLVIVAEAWDSALCLFHEQLKPLHFLCAHGPSSRHAVQESTSVSLSSFIHFPLIAAACSFNYETSAEQSLQQFLGACEKLPNAAVSFVISVRQSICVCVCVSVSVRMEQLGSYWTDFDELWYLRLFRKSFEKIQVSLKSYKNNGYFTRRRFYIYDNISLNYS